MRHVVLLALLLLSYSFADAQSAPRSDDRAIKFNELQEKADSGYSWAQYQVGKYYWLGQFPVSKDPKKAEDYFLKAANQKLKTAVGQMAMIMSIKAADHSPENVSEFIKWSILFYSLDSADGIKDISFYLRPDSQFKAYSESSITEGRRRALEFKFTMEGKGGYQVVLGDTLKAISRRTGLTLEQLKILNPRVDLTRLSVGQILMTK